MLKGQGQVNIVEVYHIVEKSGIHKFFASKNFCASNKFCASKNFCASSKFCAGSKFCTSRNFCASSKFCAGSNFCASRNVCVLFVLLLYVPRPTTLVMVRRSAHLITSFLGNLEEAVNQYYVMGARALDPGPSGRGFEPHRRHCIVPLSKKHLSCLVPVQPRKTRPCITERLLMGLNESNHTSTSSAYFRL